MFDITMTTRHRGHQVPHGPGKGKGSVIGKMMLRRNTRGGGDSKNEMRSDLGSRHSRSGTHGEVTHGPTLVLLGREMTAIRGAHNIQEATRDLQIGGQETEDNNIRICQVSASTSASRT